jgi:2-haloacid dehalogenase
VKRWATFDCYGTLVDWNTGIRRELERLLPGIPGEQLLARYHELEPVAEQDAYRTYREVLAAVLAQLADENGVRLPPAEADALAGSLPSWPVFPEAPAALAEARRRGFRLCILSNSDRDLLAASREAIGVPIDLSIVAEDVGSYKPAHGHWQRFFADSGAERSRHVHVGASLFHDIAPAHELGLRSVWVNRLGETSGPVPDREIPDLTSLPGVLAELVRE